MPRVSRVMKKEADDLPRVGPTDLGIRSVDVDVDTQNHVIVNGKGMSVAPHLERHQHYPHPEEASADYARGWRRQ